MSAPLIIPPHIKQARLAAIGAGLPAGPDDVATTVLYLAAVAYNRLPQVNKAEMLRQAGERTQHELEKVSGQLSAERKKTLRLGEDLTRLTLELQQVRSELGSVRSAYQRAANSSGQQESFQDRIPKSKAKQLHSEIGALRQELARRPAHSDEVLRERWHLERGQKRGLRQHLRQLSTLFADPTLAAEQKTVLAQQVVARGLLIGLPNEEELAKALVTYEIPASA